MTIYLYIKQHSITGLKYFGRTKSVNPFKYLGSGDYWESHLKKYDKKYVKTLEIWGFDDQELCTEFALKFSKDNNIVESKYLEGPRKGKKIWANLIPEDGVNGGYITEETKLKISKTLKSKEDNHLSKSKKFKDLMSLNWQGDKNPSYRLDAKQRLSRPKTEEHKKNLSKPKPPRSETHTKNHSDSLRKRHLAGLTLPPKRIECSYCKKLGGANVMKRWHFDNCKSKS